MTTYRSLRTTASRISCPSPGQPMTTSRIAEPLSNPPSSNPKMVISGLMALRTACLFTTTRSASPLARAVLT